MDAWKCWICTVTWQLSEPPLLMKNMWYGQKQQNKQVRCPWVQTSLRLVKRSAGFMDQTLVPNAGFRLRDIGPTQQTLGVGFHLSHVGYHRVSFFRLFNTTHTASDAMFDYILGPRSRSLAPPTWWHHTGRERRQSAISRRPTCLSAKSQQEWKTLY